MDHLNKFKDIESLTIAAIGKDTSLQTTIIKAKMDDIECASLRETEANRFQTLQQIWDHDETKMSIDAYRIDKPQFLLNRIFTTRFFLSLC